MICQSDFCRDITVRKYKRAYSHSEPLLHDDDNIIEEFTLNFTAEGSIGFIL